MIGNLMVRHYLKKRKHLKYSRHRDGRAFYKLGKLFLILISLVAVHTVAMVWFENLSGGDALWLSLTTVTTVGYGDVSAVTWQGRLSTVVCMYTFAISILAQLAAEFVEYRIQVREDKKHGNWVWKKMKNHLLIINTPDENTEQYLGRFLSQIRKTPGFQDVPIQILTRKYSEGLPLSLTKHGACHFNGSSADTESLQAVNIQSAKYVVILANDFSSVLSDSLTFDVLSRIQEMNIEGLLAAECVYDTNRARLRKVGADVVIRPVRAYPELLVRAIDAPGTEAVLENLFIHEDDHMVKVDVSLAAISWKDIVLSCVKEDAGIPLAYVHEGGIESNPDPDHKCTGSSLILLSRDNQVIDGNFVAQCLNKVQ